MARERDVNVPGGGHNLRNYWVRGEGAAKIGWGTDGSFARCVSHLGKHVKDPQGLCAEYHKAATGEWPAEKGVESAVSVEEFHGTHNQQDHDPTKGKSNLDKLKSLVGMKPGDVKVPPSKGGLTSEKIRGTKAKEPFIDRRSNGYEDDEDTTGDVGGDLEDDTNYSDEYLDRVERESDERRETHSDEDDDSAADYSPRYSNVRDTSTHSSKLKRLAQLEEKLESNSGLSDSEYTEYKRLRRIIADLEDENDDDFYDDFSLTTNASPGTSTMKKRKKTAAPKPMSTYADEPWEGVLVVEGTESGDSRLFGLGSLDWAELPMPLQYQPASIGGHNGSITVGEITQAVRRGHEIYGWGNIFGTALNGEHGEGIKNTMKVGGVSVDVDSVKDADVELVFADAEEGSNPFAKPETTIFHRGRIRGATLVAFPAFVEAKLSFTGVLKASVNAPTEDCGCTDSTVLTASSHTITIPNLPPASWFNEPTDVVSYGALTITDEGRVFGVVAPADTTHRNVKTKVPRNLDFSRFLKGETIVEGGGRVVTGVITASCGHAATQNYGTLNNRLEHYDNSCSVLANVNVGYARDGAIWVAGALNPGADGGQVAQALGCALSLDVQPHPDRQGVREFIAAHLVPVPGFPLARTRASVLYNDGVLSACAVPVDFTDQPRLAEFDVYHLVQSTKMALAASIGRDPASRKKALRESLGR